MVRQKVIFLLIAIILSSSPILMEETEGSRSITPADDPEPTEDGYFKGVLPNPHSGQTFDEAYENVSLHSQFVPVWGRPSPFYNLSTDLEGPWGDIFVEDLIRGNGMFPLIHMSFFAENMTLQTPPEMSTATLETQAWRQLYIDSAKAIVNASRPKYLSLGNEVNRWYEHHGPNGFDHYISLYNETYDAVKALSPETVVFCTFSREIVSENREANMSVLNLFDPDRLDMIVLTTYPHSVQGINGVDDIPDDYYSSVFNHTDRKKFGFSEAAWPSIPHFGGEGGQSRFLENITKRLTQGMDLELLGWPWLHDIGPTDATGLKYNDGTPKSVFETWKNNTEPTYDRNNRTIDLEEDFGIFEYDLNNTFKDPGDTLSYYIWNGTEYTDFMDREELNASIEDHYLKLVSYENRSGSLLLRIKAEDSMRDSNWTFFQVGVDPVNDPPMLRTDLLEIYEDVKTTIAITDIITDAEEDPANLNVTISSPLLKAELGFTTTSLLYLTPPPEYFGNTTISFRIRDSEGSDVNLSLNITVIPVEDLPVIDSPDRLEMDEDSVLSLNTTGWFSDNDPDDVLSIKATTSRPNDLAAVFDDIFLNITSRNDWHGEGTIYINASDGKRYVIKNIDILVRAVNDPPAYTEPGILNMTEDTDLFFPVDNLSPFDREGETIIFTFERSSPVIRSAVFPGNDTIRISPALNAYGEGNLTLSMRDPSGGITYIELRVNVNPVNDPPTLFTPSNWTVHIKRGETYWIDISSYPYISEDVDDDMENVSLVTDCDWCSGNWSRIRIDVPAETITESRNATFRLSDGKGGLSEEVTLTINVILANAQKDPIITGSSISIENGTIVASAEGDKEITVFLVIENSGERSSFQMIEDENIQGKYYLRLDHPELESGEEFSAWISLMENGTNASGIEKVDLVYGIPIEEEDDQKDPIPLIAAVLMAVLMVVLILSYILTRKRRDHEE